MRNGDTSADKTTSEKAHCRRQILMGFRYDGNVREILYEIRLVHTYLLIHIHYKRQHKLQEKTHIIKTMKFLYVNVFLYKYIVLGMHSEFVSWFCHDTPLGNGQQLCEVLSEIPRWKKGDMARTRILGMCALQPWRYDLGSKSWHTLGSWTTIVWNIIQIK